MISDHAEHPRQPHDELPAVGMGIEGVAVFLRGLGHRRHVPRKALGELPRRSAGGGHGVELEVAVGAEVEAQARSSDRVAEKPGQGFDELGQRPAKKGATVVEKIIGRAEQRQVAGGVEHADELFEVARQARFDRALPVGTGRVACGHLPVGLHRLADKLLWAENEHMAVGIGGEPKGEARAAVERLAVNLLGRRRSPGLSSGVVVDGNRKRLAATEHHATDHFVGAPRLPGGLEISD